MTISIATIALCGSALLIFLLGAAHLVYTFHGNKLRPSDATLSARMAAASPNISRQTTLWKAWIGFNASHSMGALLFGAIFGYLALVRFDVFQQAPFLQGLGLAFLAGLLVLGKVYWFSTPYRAIAVALALYVAAIVAIHA